jgi:hypothetical protein
MFTSILRRRVSAALAAGAAAVAVVGLAAPAGASTGALQTSPEQAGYTANHALFKHVEGTVYLRSPAQYAGMVARYGHSAQLWSSGMVVTVGFTASTSRKSYTPSVTIYDRSTHQVIASDPNAQHLIFSEGWSPGVGPSVVFDNQLRLTISYSPATGQLNMEATNPLYGSYGTAFDIVWSYQLPGQSFSKARIGTEFGGSPWDTSYSYTPPAKPVKAAAYTGVHLTSYSGHRDDLSSWWMHHKLLALHGRSLVAFPNDLTNSGGNFQTWFAPKSAQSAS